MISRKPIIVILLDAFRWDYLNPIDSPFLWSCSHAGTFVRKLRTTSGFTQRSGLFCGAFPDKTRNFAMFSLDQLNSPFRFLIPMQRCLPLLQFYIDKRFKGSGLMDRWLRNDYIYPRARRFADHPPPAQIPLHLLPFIGVTEDDKPIHQPGAFCVESIFDVMQRHHKGYRYLMFPVVNCQDDEALDILSVHARKKEGDVQSYFIQFSDSDSEVHKSGSEGIDRRKVVGEIDRKVRELWAIFEREAGGARFVVVGDHGMMDVEEYFNVSDIVHAEAKRFRLRHGQDYLLFLDSTFARLWRLSTNSAGDSFFTSLLQNPELARRGRFLSDSDSRKYRIPFPDRKYGDLIWWAAPGVLIYPDYFHPRGVKVKAMHGYDSDHDKMKGLAIAWGDQVPIKTVEEARLVDVCPTLCDLMHIPAPSSNEGVSLYQ